MWGFPNWVWGRGEKRETILLPRTAWRAYEHHATHTLAAALSLSYTHSVWRHASILTLLSLSVGPSPWHAAHPWDRHGFYYDECKWNLFPLHVWHSSLNPLGQWCSSTTYPHPSITHIFQQQHCIRDLETWSNQFALDEKEIPSNCNSIG